MATAAVATTIETPGTGTTAVDLLVSSSAKGPMVVATMAAAATMTTAAAAAAAGEGEAPLPNETSEANPPLSWMRRR